MSRAVFRGAPASSAQLVLAICLLTAAAIFVYSDGFSAASLENVWGTAASQSVHETHLRAAVDSIASSPSASCSPAASASPSPPPPRSVRELLPLFHPVSLYTAKDKAPYRVVLASSWFGGEMPYFTGAMTCPVSGCRIIMQNRGANQGEYDAAHVLLYHMDKGDFWGENNIPAPRHASQHVGLYAAETFLLAGQPDSLYARFSTELSFRPSSFVRDSYILTMINDWFKQGISRDAEPQRPITVEAKVWGDIWARPLTYSARRQDILASWSTHYCRGAQSNREDLVRGLLDAGLPIMIFGADANCLRNAPDELNNAERFDQFAEMRRHPFYLAFENARLEGYVTEKFFWALLRGQVPVVYGAPDIARHSPGPGSYIDASTFDSPQALADYLKLVAGNETLYNSYHAWRTNRPFDQYGDILRDEILEMIWIGASTLDPPTWFNCRACHAMRRWEAEGGLTKPKFGIKPIGADMLPAWVPSPSPTPPSRVSKS